MMSQAPTPSILSLLRDSTPIKVIDIGASPIDGSPPYAPLLAAGGAQVVGFEPNPGALAELNQRKGPNEIYLPYAVGDGRPGTLRYCRWPGMTSLLQPNAALLTLFHGFSEWSEVLHTERIDTVRLDDIPETEAMDFLKIDVQGAELMVFQNATKRLDHAVLVHTEVEFLPMYVDQPLFSDIDHFLREHGFIFHRFQSIVSRVVKPMRLDKNPYAGLSQLFWADAIFIRDFTKVEKFSPDQLLRLAVILHDCYRSFDVTMLLLTEFDRRMGTGLGFTYSKALSGMETGPV